MNNPYAAPEGAPKPPPERKLGAWVIGFMALQIVGNVYLAGILIFTPDVVRAADPGAPDWSFPARVAFTLGIVATCVGILARRRVALYAYFAVSLMSFPLNLARGVTSIQGLIGGALAAPVILWLLVRKKLPLFR